MKPNKVEIIEKKRIFDDFFKIDEVKLKHQCFNGEMSKEMRRLNFERGDSVAAILWNKDTQKMVLTEQFRYPTHPKGPGWITEILAGILRENESPAEAVKREILEETGYQVNQVREINRFYVSPGGTSERIILFYAEVTNADKIEAGGGLASEHEDIRVFQRSIPELEEDLQAGDIADAKTLIAILLFLRFLHE